MKVSALAFRYQFSSITLRMALSALGILTLSACLEGPLEQRTDQPQNAADVVGSADLRPHYVQSSRESVDQPPAKSYSFFGTATPVTDSAPPTVAVQSDSKDGFELNFENSPVTNVAKVVLGDVMGIGYVIDPRVQGTISLSSGRPIAKKDMLFVLESALRANNLMMVRDTAGYRIAPANDGSVGTVDRAGSGAEPGYGTTVIPLQYASAPTLVKLLEGIAAHPGAIRSDPSGQMLLVVGNGAERQSALDTVRSFDVDWMRGQSVGIYPVQNSSPEPVISELEKIMDSGESGLGHGLVKFQAVARQNAILVVASKPELLRMASTWIARLDSPNSTSAGVEVYKVRYGEAKQLAQLLNDIFVGQGGANSLDSAANQIAPNSGATSLSPAERLTGGKPASGLNPTSGTGTTTNVSTIGGGSGASGNNGGVQTAAASPFGNIPTAALTNAFSAAGVGATSGSALAGVRITADTVNNSILIYASRDNYKIIERTLNKLDRPKLQVAIDVTIAEVTLNDALDYGVQFYLSNKYGSLINTVAGLSPPSAIAPATGTTTSATGTTTSAIATALGLTSNGTPAGLNLVAGNAATPQVILNALHALTDVRVLSNPSLVVVDNQQATLEVGDQVPISTGSATVLSASNTVVNTVDYKNTGIILNVQPRVNSNGNVLLDIEQEISSVPPSSTPLTPTISQRKVKSQISVVSGQMVLLAGLISETQTNSRSGVPVLDQLPILGSVFGTSTDKSRARTELIIFIRPQIIRDGADASRIAEELRAKMRGGSNPSVVSLPAALNVGTKPLQ